MYFPTFVSFLSCCKQEIQRTGLLVITYPSIIAILHYASSGAIHGRSLWMICQHHHCLAMLAFQLSHWLRLLSQCIVSSLWLSLGSECGFSHSYIIRGYRYEMYKNAHMYVLANGNPCICRTRHFYGTCELNVGSFLLFGCDVPGCLSARKYQTHACTRPWSWILQYVAAGQGEIDRQRGDPFHLSNLPQLCNCSIHFGSVSLYLYSTNINLMMDLSGSACLAGYLKGSWLFHDDL